MNRRCIAVCAALVAVMSAPVSHGAEAERTLTVFAAASLTNVLQDLGDAFTKQTSVGVKFSFAASSTLARQIEQGAPADVFLSADIAWMDYLQSRLLIQESTRRNVVGNRLVLIAPADSHPPIVYPVAVTRTGQAGADQFVSFVTSPAAAATFRSYGFEPAETRYGDRR